MFHHVLLATDFSDSSERALELAAGLATSLRARVSVLHVYESAEATFPAMAAIAERTWPRVKRARGRLSRSVETLRARGVRADGVLRFGILPEAIVEAAEALGADVIVTGTHARRGLARVLHGSVAEQLLRHASVPVVVAGAAPDGEREPGDRDNVIPLRAR